MTGARASRPASPALPLGTAALVVLALAGCPRQQMGDQPRFEALEPADRFPDDQSALDLPPGVMPRGWTLARPPEKNPVRATPDLMARGQDLFSAICAPCHGLAGYGDGMVVRRGFPPPPSYHTPRLRAVSDRYVFNVITHGHGLMYSYANRVAPSDRWAVVAYVRALQLSQWADAAGLPPALQQTLALRRREPDPLLPARAREREPERPPLPEDALSEPALRPAVEDAAAGRRAAGGGPATGAPR